jgi:hypothetical protein
MYLWEALQATLELTHNLEDNMFKFNSDHIMVGQIKQILNTFNLPSYKVYTKEYEHYFNNTGTEHPGVIDGLYIKDRKVQRYANNTWQELATYDYNQKILNITKHLKITNNFYDEHTHEYLGDFLRFQRDFLGLDLMPLYNCFGKRVCNHIDISIDKKKLQYKYNARTATDELVEVVERKRHAFWSKDEGHIIYMVPIKFFKEYTIAIDAPTGIETCCGFFNDYLEEFPTNPEDNQKYRTWSATEQKYVLEALPRRDINQLVINATFRKFSELRFNNPFVWNELNTEAVTKIITQCLDIPEIPKILITDSEEQKQTKQRYIDLANAYRNQLIGKESDLKLFIKIPINNKSSITVLEGNYLEFNNKIYKIIHKTRKYRTPLKDASGRYMKDENGDYIYDSNAPAEEFTFTAWESIQNKFITNYEMELTGERTITYNRDVPAEAAVIDKKILENEKNDTQKALVDFEITTLTNPEVEDRPFKPISPLQLLMLNTGTSYPFATRLLEYLSGNVITDFDNNTDNIKRVQTVMELNRNYTSLPGAWEGKMRNILYDYMMNGKPTGEKFPIEVAHDVLGYVDKDVEKYYTAWKHDYCLDGDGNYIPVQEKIFARDEDGNLKLDENGKAIYDTVQLFRTVALPLTEADKKLLQENRTFILTVQDTAEIPVYKEVYKPICTISNVDIY